MSVALFVVGLVLQIGGTILAGLALWDDWREHGHGQPLVPAAARAGDALRERWRRFRGRPTVVEAHLMADGALVADAITVTKRDDTEIPEDASPDEIRRIFNRRMSFLNADLEDVRREVRAAEQRIDEKLERAEALSAAQHTAAERRFTALATGRIRQELLGLVLVGIGSIISAFGGTQQ